jgi:hypothetical protein
MTGFPTTAWTVVSRARSGVDSEAREALAFLCAAYWLPLYSFARRLGHASEDALDLTQGYFALLIENPSIANFKPPPAWRSIRQGLEVMQPIRAA